MVVDWGRESCLGLAEISSLCSWFNSRMGTQGESKISYFVSDINQKNEELEYKKELWKRFWVCVEFAVAG